MMCLDLVPTTVSYIYSDSQTKYTTAEFGLNKKHNIAIKHTVERRTKNFELLVCVLLDFRYG